MSSNDSTDRREGRAYIPILIFVIMAIGIILSGYLYYLNYKKHFRANFESHLSSIGELKVGEISMWRKERLGDGAVLFKNEAFSTLVRRYLEKPGDADAQRQLRAWIGKYHTAYKYAKVSLFDAKGTLIMSVPQTPEPGNAFIAHNAMELMRSGQVTFTDFHRDTPEGPINLDVVVPIIDESDANRPLGVVIMNIDPTLYLYPFISKWPTPSQTGETLLVRKDGDDVLFLNEVKFYKNAALNLRIPLTKTEVPAVVAALGETGTVEGLDYRGEPVIAAINHVPDSAWAMVVRINTSEVYAPVKERLWLMIALVGVLIVSAGVAMSLVWRQRSVRFYREQLKAAEVFRRSESLLSSTQHLAKIGGWEHDVENQATFWTDEVYYIHEIDPGNVAQGSGAHIAKSVECYEPDDRPAILAAFERCVKEGTPYDMELPFTTAKGRKLWVRAMGHPQVGMDGKIASVIGNIMDITERKRAEIELRQAKEEAEAARKLKDESAEKIKQLLDSMGEAVYGIGLDGNCTFVNSSCLRILGYQDTGQLIGKHMHNLIHHTRNDGTPYPQEKCKIYEAFLEGRGTHADDEVLWRADGASFPAEYRSFPIWSDGKTTGSVVTFTDITERKRAENELREAKEQAEAATKLKDKFVELVAHDLRSPFTSMMGLFRLFGERKSLLVNEDDKKILDRVFKSADRMMAMIDQLLNISRLQTGQITPQPRFFKGHMAAAVTIGALAHNAAQKGIVIINEVPVDMRLYDDPPLYDEVLLNLLSNAIKFCSKGDTITFFAPPGLRSAMAIRDTGKGIDENKISDLFKHEVQTTTPGTAGEVGTGLGLPFSRDIMEAHGGELTVESSPGKGSVFCAKLPHVTPLALVVDDDPDMQVLARIHLAKIGIDVMEAMNGERALSAVKDRLPHIIITDIMMPVMDGFTLLENLKKGSATSAIPVIVITSADREIRDKAFRLGADDFVSKPIEVDDFIPRVRRFVG